MKNKWKKLGIILVGIVLALLGLLWLLQGIGVIQMCPVLCFANCECITGGSPVWAMVGAAVLVIGSMLMYRNLGLRKQPDDIL